MENAQLTIADLASIQSIIEAASQRGAFRAEELTQVGTVYDKLSAFLQAAQSQVATAEQGTGETTASPETLGEQNA